MKASTPQNFQAAHYMHAARKGTTPEKIIAKVMNECKRNASAKPLRVFPCGKDDLRSTEAYVIAYYRLNSSRIGSVDKKTVDYVNSLFLPLNTDTTTWPEGPDVIVTVEADGASDLV
jgi:hypothetical protein